MYMQIDHDLGSFFIYYLTIYDQVIRETNDNLESVYNINNSKEKESKFLRLTFNIRYN